MVVLVAFTMPSISVLAASPDAQQGIHLTRIGHPTWKPVDVHLFSTQMGTAADGYAEFFPQLGYILPPPYHLLNPTIGGIGPGAPHKPPYNTEMAKGLAKLGYHQGVEFRRSEFSNGMGVYIVWMTVPDPGVTGSSPDFASGPIIPKPCSRSRFPESVITIIKFLTPIWRLLLVFQISKAGDLIKMATAISPISSPITLISARQAAKLNGSYVYAIDEIDASRNGWHIDAHFTVGG